jgi:hypothetical protein
VTERRRDLALAVEPFDDRLVHFGRQQHLDGAWHLEGPVDPDVDGAHAALTELCRELVWA